jgi:thiol-disulfide isomerase/thioredoxin
MTGVWVLLAVLALSTAFGLAHRARSGRLRVVRGSGASVAQSATATTSDAEPDTAVARSDAEPDTAVAPPNAGELVEPGHGRAEGALADVLTRLGQQPGERATLLQFSSAFCAPCRATRRILGEVAELVPGVRHVEVDAEQHLDVVRELRIMKTPTTLVLDADTRVTARASGQPRKAEVLAALGHAVP